MGKIGASTKRIAIDKANAQVVAVVAASAFITVFCLFAAKAVWSQNSYQSRLTDAKTTANNQLKKNIDSYNSLARSYAQFVRASTNIIGGTAAGTGDNDGDNSKIILDALPYKYDFPALTSSIEKIVADNNLKIVSITGTDDQVNQEGNAASGSPQAVEMPFAFTVNNANYQAVQQLIKSLQHSIRPIVVDKMNISGGGNNMTVNIEAHTFYQPAKNVSISKKVIK